MGLKINNIQMITIFSIPFLGANLKKFQQKNISIHDKDSFFFFFFFLRAKPAAYGGSQARGLIRAAAAGLNHSHSNAGS